MVGERERERERERADSMALHALLGLCMAFLSLLSSLLKLYSYRLDGLHLIITEASFSSVTSSIAFCVVNNHGP